jgi:ABC-2 type transport system permease protein
VHSLYWLTRKNLLRFFADRRGAVVIILLPMVLGTLMGALMAPKAGPKDLPILVVQEDPSPAVTGLVEAIDAHDMFTVERATLSEARARVGSGASTLALVLPEGTGEALAPSSLFTGRRVEATILHDPSRSVQLSIATGLLTQVLMQEMGAALTDPAQLREMFGQLRRELDAARASDPSSVDPRLLEFIDRGGVFAESLTRAPASGEDSAGGGGLRPPIDFVAQALTAAGATSGYNHYAHNYAGMLLIFLLFAATSSAQALLREREDGVLLRIQLSRVGPASLLLASGLSTALIALCSSFIVYAVGISIFGIEVRGPVFGFALVVACQALFVGAFGVLLAGLGRSEKQISSLSTLIVLPAALLGGAMVPSFLFPDWVQSVQTFIPTFWATHGLAAMTWRGSGWDEALLSSAALLAFALVFVAIGLRSFSWEGE